MICAVDEILEGSKQTIQEATERFMQELAVDFNLEIEISGLAATQEAAALRGALQTFAVWMVQHSRKK
ncbi:hypothetical protein [Candidatus Magnetaquicoccus inordinatus]|uniref:hypothetical protein n=1 Tax=Candidatus Magnetaquicoccus inordinatus TaxID=2496818 RepID=UPI00102C39F8|nr:hypothetical protein [Candidatus Magnetaquicoccus inordinatus]